MHIDPFAVEIWMNEWETRCEINLAETCVDSLTIAELLSLAGRNTDDLAALAKIKMTYGDIRGSARLRQAIAALYADHSPDDVIVTHGTIGANMLVHKAMIAPGDHVVAVVPSYQQHYSIPAALGADLHQLRLKREDAYLPDLDALRALVSEKTKLIALTNPNNPTGALIERSMLEDIAAIARAAGAWVLCDEVYRGVDQEGSGTTASITEVYEKGIATCGMSKAFSLAGLRLGWVAAPASVIEAVAIHRDYDTISVGRIDDSLAAIALENHARVLDRSRRITRGNLSTLENWLAQEPRLSWIKPRSGTTTLLDVESSLPARAFCTRLLGEEGVMFTPGDCFDMEGTVRIGFANPASALEEGLARVSDFLKRAP